MALVIGYLVLALLGHMLEAAGVRVCGCDPDCWCKKPGLSLFRWVFPRYHHNQQLAAWKLTRFEGLGEPSR
jgi:hypothetical protein